MHAKVKGGKPASCQGCHGSVHTTVRSNDPTAPMSDLNQVRNCGVCHEEMMEGYLSSVHAKSLFVSGLTEAAPACSDCHGSHDILRHTDANARSSHQKSPETCGECHKGILKEWDESAHGALWRDGKEGPVCTTCHEAHAVQSPTTIEMRKHMPTDCGNCHADLYKTFHDSFHGKATGRRPRVRGHVLGLPHTAPQPAGERPALVDPPGQPRSHLRLEQLPRGRSQRVVPDLHPAQRPDGQGPERVGALHLPVHDAAAARRVRLLRPARAALAAAHAGRPPARRVQGRSTSARGRTCGGSRPRRCGCTSRSS